MRTYVLTDWSAYLLTYSLAHTCLLRYLRTLHHVDDEPLLTCLPTYLLTYLLRYLRTLHHVDDEPLLTCLPTYLLTYLLRYLRTLHHVDDEPLAPLFDFDVDVDVVTESELRNLMWDEIRSFHPGSEV